MDFKTNKPIYQQIVDFCFSKILTREWRAEERVVSVRELSTQLAVNSRTVLKVYEYLRRRTSSTRNGEWGSTFQRCGEESDANTEERVFDNQLADMFHSMELLGISIEEITERYNKLKKDGS